MGIQQFTHNDRDRLAKLCGMLGSNHDGERAAAALKASQFLKARKLTWRDVIGTPVIEAPEPSASTPPETFNSKLDTLYALAACGRLTEWEERFVHSVANLADRGMRISMKQRHKIAEIYEQRVEGGE